MLVRIKSLKQGWVVFPVLCLLRQASEVIHFRKISSTENWNLRRVLTNSINWKHLLIKVVAHSGCYNKIPQPGWLINSRHLFLTVRRLEVQGQGVGMATTFSPCPHRVEVTSSMGLFYRALILHMRAPPSTPNHLLTLSYGGLSFNMWIWREHTHSHRSNKYTKFLEYFWFRMFHCIVHSFIHSFFYEFIFIILFYCFYFSALVY